jgi:hypothetical protein
MIKKKETINGPEDVLEAVLFKVSKFPDDFSVEFYEQKGYPVRCVVCKDKYDPEDPDSVELAQVTATVLFNFQTEEGIVTIPPPLLVRLVYKSLADKGKYLLSSR